MKSRDRDYLKARLEKLEAENRALRERAASTRIAVRDLEKALKKGRIIFDSVPVGLFLIQQGRIVEINRTAQEQLGLEEEECIGRDFTDFVPPEPDNPGTGLDEDRVTPKWSSSQYEVDIPDRGGEIFEYDVRVRKIKYRGRRSSLAVLSRLDHRRQREKEVIRREKMEALVTMASGLQSKIGESLGIIRENTHRFRTTGGLENRDIMKGVENIEAAADQILKRILELEKLSRREPDRSMVRLFDLKSIVEDVKASLQPRITAEAEARGVTHTIKTYLRSESSLTGDPCEIRDVIINMILNAMDAMPRGGDIYLSTEESGGNAYIYIQDSGEGIADPINGRILDPYFTTKGGKGAGLGLSISYAIIKRHHGDMEVMSGKGEGTTVTIKLPLPEPEAVPKGHSLRSRIKNARILIISNEHITRELLTQVLRVRGYRVSKATDGLEGLLQMKKRKFDMVIADMAAAGHSGKVLAAKIRRRYPQVPVVMIRPRDRGPAPERPEAAASLVLTKPINMDNVAAQVSEVLIRNEGEKLSGRPGPAQLERGMAG